METKVLWVHIVGVAVVAGTFALGISVLKPHPEAAIALFGLAAGLYGKLGFKPLNPVLEQILVKKLGITPQAAKRITSKPPPPKDEATP